LLSLSGFFSLSLPFFCFCFYFIFAAQPNAGATFSMLNEEGRHVAAALLPEEFDNYTHNKTLRGPIPDFSQYKGLFTNT